MRKNVLMAPHLQSDVHVKVADLGQEGAVVAHDAGHADFAAALLDGSGEAGLGRAQLHRQRCQHVPAITE